MKSNRLFYIGLGCILSTLCWTLTAAVVSDQPIYPYKDKKEILQVDHLICSEFSLVNEEGIEIIGMFKLAEKGHVIAIKEGIGSNAHLILQSDGMRIYNSQKKSVVGIRNVNDAGLLYARNDKAQPTWVIDGNSYEPIQIQPPQK